jgi:hypothetical protein
VGLRLRTLDPEVRPFIFHWRKEGGRLAGRARSIGARRAAGSPAAPAMGCFAWCAPPATCWKATRRPTRWAA